jgi:transposase
MAYGDDALVQTTPILDRPDIINRWVGELIESSAFNEPVSNEMLCVSIETLPHCRRAATRYDRLAANYLAFVQLASIRLWLRIHESAS